MKHLGDITKINGAEIELVDVIVGGSPCQDLSVAGKRSGLDGERSGLFMEQIRIVREQRNESIKRSDNPIRPRYMVWENVPGAFSSNKAEDFRVVLEETARIADSNAVIPRPPTNKWATAGCVMGDGWSIAWRVQDAQFWGVPQRRRRIALVADFGGQSAPEILFERKGVPGDIEASGEAGQGTARNAAGGAGEASGSLSAVAPFDTTQITSPQNKNRFEYGAPCHTLNANAHVPSIVLDMTHANDVIRVGNQYAVRRLTPLECERLQGYPDGWTDIPNITIGDKLVKASDTARYKALGNSIALPPWRFVLSRIHSCGARTLGSLFDGIGGFPLIWSELPDTATLWASEIEPFPIAVTTIRFNGEVSA